MATRRGSKLVLTALLAYTRRNTSLSALRHSAFEIHHTNGGSTISSVSNPPTAYFHSSTTQKIFGLARRNNIPYGSTAGAKRFYGVPTYYESNPNPRRWPIHKIVMNLIKIGVSCAAGYAIYSRVIETVPITKRKHFVLPCLWEEEVEKEWRAMVDEVMENMKILDPTHPDSVRVTAIFNRIIEALYRRLREDDDDDDDTTKRPHYLYGWKWEIVVVDYPGVAASFVLGGKMCVSTGLLKHMQSDGEIATLIAREVAHAVARHILEFFSKKSWILFPYGIIRLISRDRAFSILYNHFDTKCPFSHKMYVEADHIGLLLMASAGYDPRVAPKVSEKLEKLSREIREMPYLDTYASGGERPQFQLLARAPVMEEALYWYRESEKPGPDVGTESCIE